MTSDDSTTGRGYGYRHQKLREALLPYAYGRVCHFCGLVMRPGQLLDLDHNDSRTGYRGMSHRKCNRAEGARKSNENQRRRRGQDPGPSRRW